MTDTQPFGLVEGLPNEDYQADPGISKGKLDKIAHAPAVYWHEYLRPNRETRVMDGALLIGEAFHDAVLQPELFDTKWLKSPDFNLRTKAGREARDTFAAENPGTMILHPDDFSTVRAMQHAVLTHPTASKLLTGGRAEQSWFGIDPETGARIKCRTDYRNDARGVIVDLKSTKDAGPGGFAKSIANFRYHVQEAWYRRVLGTLDEELPHWVWVAVEKTPPYLIGIYTLTADDVNIGHNIAMRNFARLLQCQRDNHWPDYSDPRSDTDNIRTIALPGWARKDAA